MNPMSSDADASPKAYAALARYYDLQHNSFVDDIPMYLKLLSGAPKHVLEIGCGSGRVMLPLLRAGHHVTGVDDSPEMLAIAQRYVNSAFGGRAQLLQRDARAIALDERFDMVVIALNTFLHNLTLDDQLSMLRVCQRHLQPNGSLVIDLPPNDELAHQPDDDEFEFEVSLIDPTRVTHIDKFVASRIHWATQRQHLRYKLIEQIANSNPQEYVVDVHLRHVFKHEMELLLQQAGFSTWRWFGGYDLSDYADDSLRMIVQTKN